MPSSLSSSYGSFSSPPCSSGWCSSGPRPSLDHGQEERSHSCLKMQSGRSIFYPEERESWAGSLGSRARARLGQVNRSPWVAVQEAECDEMKFSGENLKKSQATVVHSKDLVNLKEVLTSVNIHIGDNAGNESSKWRKK